MPLKKTPDAIKMSFDPYDLKNLAIATEFFIDTYSQPKDAFVKSQMNDLRKRILDRLRDVEPEFVLKMQQLRAKRTDS